jgi:hypothetical protein
MSDPADATVERVGDEVETAVRRSIGRRARRHKLQRLAFGALVPAALAAIAAGVYEQAWRHRVETHKGGGQTSPLPRIEGAFAASARVAIYPVVTPAGVRSDCYLVEARDGTRRIRCPTGEASRFATYAVAQPGGVTFYGRAAIPGTVRVVLRFPGQRPYAVDLQRSGYWAWDSPSVTVARARRGLVVLAVAGAGRVLARDRHPAASHGT